MPNLQEFWEQLNQGPVVLFLGQDYLRVETGTDPLLYEAHGRFGGEFTTPDYNLLLAGAASQSADAALAWMSERCRRLSAPEWLQPIAEFHWSCIYSSAIDPLWLQTFRSDWREVAPIFDDEYFPRDPRNRRILHCTYLFGSLTQTEAKLRAPLSQFEFFSRKQMAVNLARRLPEILTPLGVLAIEGYKGDRDWFSLGDLFPVLQGLGPGQAHLFSVDDVLSEHPVISELVRTGRLVTHPEGLAWALEQGRALGFIQLRDSLEWEETGRRVTLRNGSIPIPRELWNRLDNSATLMDDHVLVPPPPISNDAVYWEFRRFLFECGNRPLWSGYARRFAFRREFEKELHDKTKNKLDRNASNDQPIVIHGQTGTGKTVALGSLAYTIAKSREYPVIFIERRTQRPVNSDIDECCRWLEDHGASATLIVWDGMVQQSEYRELQGYLASRGRKAAVVGSSYTLKETGNHLVEVPNQLTVEEARQFADFLEGLGISLNERHREFLEKRDPTYLVAMYRHLAPTRQRLTTGVVQELEQLEQELVAAVSQLESGNSSLSGFAAAFLSAGIIDQTRLEEVSIRPETQISAAEVAELVDIVTVPGRFGINIPIELLTRTWEKSNFTDLSQLLRGFDLVHAFEDSAGRVVVGPRHSLEARLIVQARIGSVQNEADIVSRIVKAIRPSIWGADESDEIGFVIELLRAVGPQGEEQSRFAPFFRDLAEAISEVRESRNIRSPRMMLQEANFIREWVTTKSRQGNQPEDAKEVLGKAKSILQEALEMLKDNRQWRLRTFIATELASTLGAATVDSIISGATKYEIEQNYEQVLEAVKTARSIDFSSFNPVDVLVWSTSALANSEGVDNHVRTEAIVDVLDALETVDTDLLDSGNLERFYQRRYEVGTLLGDQALSEAAFQNLVLIGSAAGFYIRAWEIGGSPKGSKSGEKTQGWEYEAAWRYLEEHRGEIFNDPRCLNLLFDYWWLSKSGHRPFDEERAVVPFQENDWLYGLELIRELRGLQNSNRGLTLSFVEALSLFHLGQITPAIQLFREIENESYTVSSRRRILRSFLASEPNGTPRIFRGTVRSVDPDGRRGQVFVEELRQRITFLPADFGRPEIRSGDSLGEFHIAFNFIGPIADPLTRSRA